MQPLPSILPGMEDVDIAILYQDHHTLIVNKPAGMVIHPTYKHADGTMWDALLRYLETQGSDNWSPPDDLPDEPAWSKAPPEVQVMLRERRRAIILKEEGLLSRPCLLHRLDKDTSGVVALARTERSRRHLVRQFYAHTIIKRYLAVVAPGAPAWASPRVPLRITKLRSGEEVGMRSSSYIRELEVGEELLIDGPLWRDPDDRRRCVVIEGGQEATTLIRVLGHEGAYSLLEVHPITGRTHQIRAHLAALGQAIVGDPVYRESQPFDLALGRQFLHARSLTLCRYPDNQEMTFMAALTSDLQYWLAHYFPSALAYGI